MINRINYYPKNYYTSDGEINFYAAKLYSKHALKSEFDIQTTLNDYSLKISLFKKNPNRKEGVIHANFAPLIQFNGNLLEFDFKNLSKNESTVILSGHLKILGIKKQKSFVGKIKRIDKTIYLNSNFILNIEEFNFDEVFKCIELNTTKRIRIEIVLQLTSSLRAILS